MTWGGLVSGGERSLGAANHVFKKRGQEVWEGTLRMRPSAVIMSALDTENFSAPLLVSPRTRCWTVVKGLGRQRLANEGRIFFPVIDLFSEWLGLSLEFSVFFNWFYLRWRVSSRPLVRHFLTSGSPVVFPGATAPGPLRRARVPAEPSFSMKSNRLGRRARESRLQMQKYNGAQNPPAPWP